MKKLVIFSTLTGNTEKIADAIFSVIEGNKELLNVRDSDKINPDDYDKIIVGYWVDKGDADEKIKAFMSKINNRTVATFGTLGAKADSDHAKKCMAAVREFLEANGNKVEREFICQGAISPQLIERFRNFFSNVTNNTEKNLYASKLSVELGIDKEVLMGELGNFSTAQKKSKKYLKKEEKVLSKAKKDEFYNSLEIETLKFLLKFKNNLSSEKQEHCEKFDDKVFENVIYKDIMEKLKTINFEITKLDSLTLEEEERELITTMKLKAEADIENEGRHYKDIFVGWFLREIDHMREIIDRKDKMYVILRRLESELKIIHNIEEIEKMYKEFKLIRRSDYV